QGCGGSAAGRVRRARRRALRRRTGGSAGPGHLDGQLPSRVRAHECDVSGGGGAHRRHRRQRVRWLARTRGRASRPSFGSPADRRRRRRPRGTPPRRTGHRLPHGASAHGGLRQGSVTRPRLSVTPFTDEHALLRRTVRAFVEKEVAPQVSAWEEAGQIPRPFWRRLGELGLLGLEFPVEYGGGGGDFLSSVVLGEEMARCRSGGVAFSVLVHTDMSSPWLTRY